MRFLRSFLLLLLVPLGAIAGTVSPLLSPAELQGLLNRPELRVIDIRDGKVPDGRSVYEAGHLPGALSAPYRLWRGPAENPGKLPSVEQLTKLLQGLGLHEDSHAVVVYAGADATDFGAAARAYWTLKVAGLRKLSILNGGVKAWQQAGLALSTDPASVPPSAYVARIDEALVATRDEVAAALDAKSARLVDARPQAFYVGDTRHAAARIPGTIHGADNLDNARWFRPGSAAFVPVEEARRVAAEAGLEGPGPVVSFCNTGHWAATNWFAMSEVLGREQVSMYPESMVDWSRAGLPMQNVPGRLKQLWIDAQLWYAKTFN